MTSNEKNKALCDRYPFLIPRNRWSGRRITDGAGFWPGSPEKVPEYDYENTELDEMPAGWRKAFGEQMCEELREELESHRLLDEYVITQIKEKYGELRWYDYGGTPGTDAVINKYMALSKRTCIRCGRAATRVTTGWVSPYCDECVPIWQTSVPIREWERQWENWESLEALSETEEGSQKILW